MKRYKRILVAMDWSELSKDAFEQALDLAKLSGGGVTVLHVVESLPFHYAELGEGSISSPHIDSIKENMERVDDQLNEFVGKGKLKGIEVYKLIEEGNVAEEIIRASSGFDIVIIGTTGHNVIATLLLGSTAEKVARHACCPVMLIREIGDECKI